MERKDSELASVFSLKDFKPPVSATWSSYLKKTPLKCRRAYAFLMVLAI
jgi:hypothetical protein